MSTWKIHSDAGNNFRWEVSDHQLQVDPNHEPYGSPIQRPSSASRLPSMADLLLQGSSKLTENGRDHLESPPMFRTGLGKSVTLKQSSFLKALSILGDECNAISDAGLLGGEANGGPGSFSNSMFQTGSGKAVNISTTGLVRAKSLLGFADNHDNESFQGFEPKTKDSKDSEHFAWQSSCRSEMTKDSPSVPSSPFDLKCGSVGSDSKETTPHYVHSASRQPPIKFHSAGGRFISVSSDALQRARSLLGDPELGAFLDGGDAGNPSFSSYKESISDYSSVDKDNDPSIPLPDQGTAKSKHMPNNFVSPLRPISYQKQSVARSESRGLGSNLIKKFNEEGHDSTSRPSNDFPVQEKHLSNHPPSFHGVRREPFPNGTGSRINSLGRSSSGPLVDISNTIATEDTDNKRTAGDKRRLGKKSSVSPFKKPRSSKFITPLNRNALPVLNGGSTLAPKESFCKRMVSTRYPFRGVRKYVEEFFGACPSHNTMLEYLPECVRRMNPEIAEKHKFRNGSGLDCIGADAFSHMLAQSGASMQFISKEWIANHYKWIVWKLACYERCYPEKSSGKLFTVSNVFEELKYRYEREVNHGHRSAIKRILEGDAPASSILVLCISSVHPKCDVKTETLSTSNAAEDGTAAKVELTDGWYSVNALLDVLLSKKLAAGKLFVGQKLKIWGAGLCGWVGPVTPLEASKEISLRLHINGTYRAHWADRLGFCKVGAPLAFRCIKSVGGAVPSTLVGITRIYPILYRERLSDGGFVVRSERMESKMIQVYNQRRSIIAEGIVSEFQIGIKRTYRNNEQDSDEGAKILKILETAAEPEVLMAEMSSEQLNSFSTYQAKLESMRQADVQKSIEKALEGAGLSGREVTPFMRVRVVGLNNKSYLERCCPREGLITIWNPTEKQQMALVEGQAYSIAGLVPSSSDSDTLYLQARGSSTKWLPLLPAERENFRPFFSPRKPVSLSNIGEVLNSSEFDIAAFVIYVGEVYTAAHQKKQWVFVTDGSLTELHLEETYPLLAISFCSPCVDCDSVLPINYNLAGSTVGFCNLIKREKDQINHLWVAEATENSNYFLNYDHAHISHLKDAASSAQRWAMTSSLTIEKLRGKVLSIIGNCKG
ncbi:hypothetical protein RJ639_037505 [Escallonia herrerae]|uniref:Tower domain-containing protein n=1 Tax=Escallonia herrerae TaxID=1293975 RepID=A0AA88WMF4_9ASTE|nr:hypothetical protein RJ639_037505 [Escallonia herrerae]